VVPHPDLGWALRRLHSPPMSVGSSLRIFFGRIFSKYANANASNAASATARVAMRSASGVGLECSCTTLNAVPARTGTPLSGVPWGLVGCSGVSRPSLSLSCSWVLDGGVTHSGGRGRGFESLRVCHDSRAKVTCADQSCTGGIVADIRLPKFTAPRVGARHQFHTS
jgi:hypothetical protein